MELLRGLGLSRKLPINKSKRFKFPASLACFNRITKGLRIQRASRSRHKFAYISIPVDIAGHWSHHQPHYAA